MARRRSKNSIALGRTFLEVEDAAEQREPDELLRMALAFGQGKTWPQVLEHRYVVVLGEAGTGKSTEFESQANALSTSGRWAFFVELNDLVTDGFVESLDPDDEKRLNAWRSTNENAVFFLDSLDEAKLQSHTLRQALRKLRRDLKDEWQRVQLVISCRVSDWRADADRADLEEVIPEGSSEKVYVVQLAPLDEGQVAKLAGRIGVSDVHAFMTAVEDNHAQIFVSRPLDVEWLGNYWERQKRIGSLRELIDDNVTEKLQERATRTSTLPRAKAERGIRALAGIATLTRQHSFLVPDEQHDLHRATSAIDPREVLADWSNEEILQLLRRPIFDESTYGRVRIHHRSVQEFLAAKWLEELRNAGFARSKLEELLFREDAGQRVIPDHLGPVVAWFCLWDATLREKLIGEAPALLMGHGDPSGLSASERATILRNYARSYVGRKRRFDKFDQASLDRFASPALAEAINGLLAEPELPDEFTEVLLQLIEHGRVAGCVASALNLALSKTASVHVRYYAIEAIGKAGDENQQKQLLSLIPETERWNQDVAGAFVRALYPELLSTEGLLQVLERIEPGRRNVMTSLQVVLEHEVLEVNLEQRLQLLQALMTFVGTVSENGVRESHHERDWLLDAVGKLLVTVLEDLPDDDQQLDRVEDALALFRWFDEHRVHTEHGAEDVREALVPHGRVRRKLFWSKVKEHQQRHGKIPTQYRELRYNYAIFKLVDADVPWLARDASTRHDVRERLLAFDTLDWVFFIQGRTDHRLRLLQSLAEKDPILRKRLDRAMRRPEPDASLRAYWERIENARKLRLKRQHDAACKALARDIDGIRSGTNFSALWFLRAQAEQSGASYGVVSHESLRSKYGEEIAQAAMNGWRAFWRTYDPPLPHEREERNTVPGGVVIGLMGLSKDIEAGLDVATLEAALVCRAVRYAACELNRFPDWMGRLAEVHPRIVAQALKAAIAADYKHPDNGKLVSDVLAKLPLAQHPVRLACVPVVSGLLAEGEPPMVVALIDSLSILLKTDGADVTTIDAIVEARCRAAIKDRRRFAVWWCVWVNGDDSSALTFLEQTLVQSSRDESYELVEGICEFFYECSERFGRIPMAVRQKPQALARLIPLVYEYIAPVDDLNHEDVSYLGPRDHAQSVRGYLVNWLTDIPGAESVAALRRVAEDPRMVGIQDGLLYKAEQRLISNLSTAALDVTNELVGLFKQYGLEAISKLDSMSQEKVAKIHVGILTIKEEEYAALLKKLGPSSTRGGAHRDYDIAAIQTSKGICRVAIARSVQQGNAHAQLAATEMLDDLSPDFMLVVGIAGGVPTPDFCLGDVIVSNYIQDLTLEDTGTGSSSRRFDMLGGPLHSSATRIVERLRAIEMIPSKNVWNSVASIGVQRPMVDGKITVSDETWNAEVSKALAEHAKREAPIATARKLASSDRLVKDPELIKLWRTTSKGVMAVEMESAGAYVVCHRKNIPVLAIRGISDIIGWQRDEAWTMYACHTAAAYTRMLIEAGLFGSESP